MITVTRDCAGTVLDCVDSVCGQSYDNREHVVIDGASSDGTLALLRARRDDLTMLVSEPDHGIYEAINKGLHAATGDVIGLLNGDDFYADCHVLERVASAFADPAVGAVYGDLDYVWKNDLTRVARHWKSQPFTPDLLGSGWMPPHPTLYVRRSWYERIGDFDTRYSIAADYFSVLQLFRQPDLNPTYLPEVLVKMRTGGVSNRSVKAIVRKSREDLDAIRRAGIGGLRVLAWKNLTKVGQFF